MAACISGNSITLLGIVFVWSNAGRWRSQKAVTIFSIWITTNNAQTWWGSELALRGMGLPEPSPRTAQADPYSKPRTGALPDGDTARKFVTTSREG
jgi:hypothetical protein